MTDLVKKLLDWQKIMQCGCECSGVWVCYLVSSATDILSRKKDTIYGCIFNENHALGPTKKYKQLMRTVWT
jgi:hypothetical protein